MNALEIVATVVLSIIGLSTILIWGKVTLLIDRIYKQYDAEKKPASKKETDEKK